MMNYAGKRVGLTGSRGFLGGQLRQRLAELGAEVVDLVGDVRDAATFAPVDHSFTYVFHFGSPSSQVVFAREAAFAISTTIRGFINAAEACERSGVKLVYPSTGVLSQGAINEYARCKKVCEDYHLQSGLHALGLRIFATYGEQEGHKRDYASVPYLFARAARERKSPLVFGDGAQVRDFIYVDDTVSAVCTLAEECNDAIVDVGSGTRTSFKQIIEWLHELSGGAMPDATYVARPSNYVEETGANPQRLRDYYTPAVSMVDGLRRVFESIS